MQSSADLFQQRGVVANGSVYEAMVGVQVDVGPHQALALVLQLWHVILVGSITAPLPERRFSKPPYIHSSRRPMVSSSMSFDCECATIACICITASQAECSQDLSLPHDRPADAAWH